MKRGCARCFQIDIGPATTPCKGCEHPLCLRCVTDQYAFLPDLCQKCCVDISPLLLRILEDTDTNTICHNCGYRVFGQRAVCVNCLYPIGVCPITRCRAKFSSLICHVDHCGRKIRPPLGETLLCFEHKEEGRICGTCHTLCYAENVSTECPGCYRLLLVKCIFDKCSNSASTRSYLFCRLHDGVTCMVNHCASFRKYEETAFCSSHVFERGWRIISCWLCARMHLEVERPVVSDIHNECRTLVVQLVKRLRESFPKDIVRYIFHFLK